MTPSFVIEIGRSTITTGLMVVAPILIVGFVVGMAISLLQAVMQIQEMTLAFVPKLVAIGAAVIIFGNWMLEKLMIYTHHMLGEFQNLISS